MRAEVTELRNTRKATPGARCSNYVRRTGEATSGERLRNSVRTTDFTARVTRRGAAGADQRAPKARVAEGASRTPPGGRVITASVKIITQRTVRNSENLTQNGHSRSFFTPKRNKIENRSVTQA